MINISHTHVDKNGRILIPNSLRKKHHFDIGVHLIIKELDGKLILMKLDDALSEAQAMFKNHRGQKISAVDEFLQIRKDEFELENRKFTKNGENEND